MDPIELDNLVHAWYRYLEPGACQNENSWAAEKLNDIFPSATKIGRTFDCELAWGVLLKMLELARKRSQLTFVGELLYRLITVDQNKIMSLIQKEAPTNSRLSYIVGFVHTTDETLRQRLRALGCTWAELDLPEERQPMRQAKLEQIAQSYLENFQTPVEERQPAILSLDELTHRDPTLCWHAVLLISQRCISNQQLNRLANSLATLLSAQPGKHFLTLLEAELLKDEKVAYLATRLRKTSLARAGWFKEWQAVIELAERQELNSLFEK